MKKKCLYCSKEFTTDKFHPFQRYCSYKCSYLLINVKNVCKAGITKKCAYCQKEFVTVKYSSNQRYCSLYCNKTAWRYKHKPLLKPRHVNCLYCKKEFITARPSRKYCSYKCSYSNNKNSRNENITINCKFCEKPFHPWNNQKDLRIYCSSKCFNEFRRGIPRSLEIKKRILEGKRKRWLDKKPTSIEKAVYDFLLLKGIVFEKQKVINGRFIVDAYIPSLNLVVEADGKYWHNLPEIKGKDNAKNAYLTKCGYNLLRLPEDEIKSGKFKEREVFN